MSEFDTDPTSLYSVKGIVILDQDGNRVIAKYFDKTTFGTTKEQKAFEKSLFQKTSRNSSSLIDAMDTCILIIDEICDEGIILETDPQSVVSRCALKADEISFSDQTFSQVGMSLMSSAKEQFKWSLLK
ncbi:unnamed protein product [Haemonchus placei]|uniref:Coatomer subunit zeta n=1 Tax=Haemonchus placei TaxID=6290 RepID=A0A0N4XAM2_HAEPC|nr:unnamed protein product [Haemonchus placei]